MTASALPSVRSSGEGHALRPAGLAPGARRETTPVLSSHAGPAHLLVPVLPPARTGDESKFACQIAWGRGVQPTPTIDEVRAAARAARWLGDTRRARVYMPFTRELFARQQAEAFGQGRPSTPAPPVVMPL